MPSQLNQESVQEERLRKYLRDENHPEIKANAWEVIDSQYRIIEKYKIRLF
jgi:hypothetical protein